MNYTKRYHYQKIGHKGEWKHGIYDDFQSKLITRCDTYEDAKVVLMILNKHYYIMER